MNPPKPDTPEPTELPPPRFISAPEVPGLLPMRECIEAVERAFLALAGERTEQPLRTVIPIPDSRSSFLTMPAWLGDPPALGAKLLTLFPGNHERGIASHQGLIVLFDPDTGSPVLVVDAGPVTALRTAAASAVATRALARDDASSLAILGSGVQARSHLEAMLRVRPIRRVRAWSPTHTHLEAFAREMEERHGLPVQVAADARSAVHGADVVCTVTASSEPVLQGEWLSAGCHVNAVGASTAITRELDSDTVARSAFFVDRMDSALAEAGDWILARSEGAVRDEELAGELGGVLTGDLPGRRAPDQITVFKSLGLAVQDLAAAVLILKKLQAD
ncbi:MAG: ornithine cyclodeaminase family protein [Gemmatimonadales bacterium]|nr:MAG: ornithine cyclodeaminase family protein [Gemmatimonadales bacterium]